MIASGRLSRAAASCLLTLSVAAFALPAVAAETKGVSTGLEETATAAFGAVPAQKDLAVVIGTFIKFALSFVGVVFMVLVVYGGFLWMTAAGNEQSVAKAKNILISAVIGMLIIASGYAITDFVIRTVQQATVAGPTTP